MVEISLSGSGEGPGWATAPGYSTAASSHGPVSTVLSNWSFCGGRSPPCRGMGRPDPAPHGRVEMRPAHDRLRSRLGEELARDLLVPRAGHRCWFRTGAEVDLLCV